MQTLIQNEIQKLLGILIHLQNDDALLQAVEKIAAACIQALRQGHKILFAGNGGSAADSQHLAAELVGRLRYHRPGLPSIALTTDTSALTAISNDYGYEFVFARQLESLAQAGDVFIGISTSGTSANILKAFATARSKNVMSICFTGANTLKLNEQCDLILSVPATETSKIQECHIMFGHIICGLIEDALFAEHYYPQHKSMNIVA